MDRKLDLSGVRIYSDTKEEELTKVRNAIAALLESLSHYTDRYGVKAYWDSYEGYEEFINSVVEACNIIEKEFAKFKDEKTYKIFRPYESIDEFCIETGCNKVGTDLLTIRNKRRKQECVLLYTGYSEDAVHLGSYVLTFETLVKHYEFYNKCGEDGEWKPFGIEE